MNNYWFPLVLSGLLILVFYSLSLKKEKKKLNMSLFECGFTSYFYSRFSFSIHYYYVGLLFLFLDLELCFLMPMLTELCPPTKMLILIISFLMSLLWALISEWKQGNLEWKS